jgi:hypothetical protein
VVEENPEEHPELRPRAVGDGGGVPDQPRLAGDKAGERGEEEGA